jgi:hypothetical protein
MHRKALTALLSAVAALVLLIAPSVASAWAPAEAATVHPGVQVFTQGAQCTANFVYQDASNVYLGQAAHCSGTGAATDTDGCDSGSLPIGTPVDVTGADHPGTLVYNSWLTMQSKAETDADTCAFNGSRARRADRGRLLGRHRIDGLQLRQLGAPRRRRGAQPEAGDRRPGHAQRLEPRRVHRHSRDPG